MTRDPARIDPILADLRRYWHAAPDLRLGQMEDALVAVARGILAPLGYEAVRRG